MPLCDPCRLLVMASLEDIIIQQSDDHAEFSLKFPASYSSGVPEPTKQAEVLQAIQQAIEIWKEKNGIEAYTEKTTFSPLTNHPASSPPSGSITWVCTATVSQVKDKIKGVEKRSSGNHAVFTIRFKSAVSESSGKNSPLGPAASDFKRARVNIRAAMDQWLEEKQLGFYHASTSIRPTGNRYECETGPKMEWEYSCTVDQAKPTSYSKPFSEEEKDYWAYQISEKVMVNLKRRFYVTVTAIALVITLLSIFGYNILSHLERSISDYKDTKSEELDTLLTNSKKKIDDYINDSKEANNARFGKQILEIAESHKSRLNVQIINAQQASKNLNIRFNTATSLFESITNKLENSINQSNENYLKLYNEIKKELTDLQLNPSEAITDTTAKELEEEKDKLKEIINEADRYYLFYGTINEEFEWIDQPRFALPNNLPPRKSTLPVAHIARTLQQSYIYSDPIFPPPGTESLKQEQATSTTDPSTSEEQKKTVLQETTANQKLKPGLFLVDQEITIQEVYYFNIKEKEVSEEEVKSNPGPYYIWIRVPPPSAKESPSN